MDRRIFLRHTAMLGAAAMGPLPLLSHADNDPAATFLAKSYPDLEGAEVPLSSYAGRPLVVNFWATWCAPCVREMPDLDALSRKYPDIGFVGVAIDTRPNIERFLKKVQVSYPLLVAGHGGIEVMKQLGNRQGGLPYTVIFDAQSRIAHQILGQVDSDDLDGWLAKL